MVRIFIYKDDYGNLHSVYNESDCLYIFNIFRNNLEITNNNYYHIINIDINGNISVNILERIKANVTDEEVRNLIKSLYEMINNFNEHSCLEEIVNAADKLTNHIKYLRESALEFINSLGGYKMIVGSKKSI